MALKSKEYAQSNLRPTSRTICSIILKDVPKNHKLPPKNYEMWIGAVIHLWAIKNNDMIVVLGGFLPTLRWGKFRLSALYSFGARLS